MPCVCVPRDYGMWLIGAVIIGLSLGLDVRVLRDDNTEVEIMETVDYSDTDYRYEMEGDSKGYNYNEEENLGKMGYQKQEFDSEKQELVSADDEETGAASSICPIRSLRTLDLVTSTPQRSQTTPLYLIFLYLPQWHSQSLLGPKILSQKRPSFSGFKVL